MALNDEATVREAATRDRIPIGVRRFGEERVQRPGCARAADGRERVDPPRQRGRSRSRVGPGSLIDLRFMLDAPIGRGAMGDVYRATDSTDGGRVALKMVQPEHADDAEIVGRFATEVTAMRRVCHPNVVQLVHAGTHAGLPYIAMEYVDGGSLDAILRSTPHGCLAIRRAVDLLRMICDGVQAIHDAGAVHGDIKAGNVFVDVEGRAVVGDLGMAMPASSCCRFSAGKTMGTPGYMAPELIVGSVVTPATASDVYALGVLAFRLLTGQLPFEAPTRRELFQRHLSAPAPRPSNLRPELPEALSDAVLEALDKDPHARPKTASAFARAVLEAVAPGRRRRWPWSERTRPRPRHAGTSNEVMSGPVIAARRRG